jgi:hypothetical protein
MEAQHVDFSTLSWRDAADISLQRTSTLLNLPVIGNPGFSLWTRGSRALLNLEAMVRKDAILVAAMNEIAAEFETIASFLGERQVERLVDIGCGHAFIDLLFYRRFACPVSLIDIERTEAQHHDFHTRGAGYSSLQAARQFLVRNGVPQILVETTNPKHDSLPTAKADVIISLLSAGFHYPISEYTAFALNALEPGGVLIFDARKGQRQTELLDGFARVDVITDRDKSERIAATR